MSVASKMSVQYKTEWPSGDASGCSSILKGSKCWVRPHVNHFDWAMFFISSSAAHWGYECWGTKRSSCNTRSNCLAVFHQWSEEGCGPLCAHMSGMKSRWGSKTYRQSWSGGQIHIVSQSSWLTRYKKLCSPQTSFMPSSDNTTWRQKVSHYTIVHQENAKQYISKPGWSQ